MGVILTTYRWWDDPPSSQHGLLLDAMNVDNSPRNQRPRSWDNNYHLARKYPSSKDPCVGFHVFKVISWLFSWLFTYNKKCGSCWTPKSNLHLFVMVIIGTHMWVYLTLVLEILHQPTTNNHPVSRVSFLISMPRVQNLKILCRVFWDRFKSWEI